MPSSISGSAPTQRQGKYRHLLHVLTSITTQFCFAGLSILLNVYALSIMPTEEALVFILAFALAQSYAPLHNSTINITLASLAPRLSKPRLASYGALTRRWSLFLSLAHAAALSSGWFIFNPEGGIGMPLALFAFCGAAGMANYLRQWFFQKLAFNRVLRMDVIALTVAITGMVASLTIGAEVVLSPAVLLGIGAIARLVSLFSFWFSMPPPMRIGSQWKRGFLAFHKRELRRLIFFSLANYLRQNLVYIILAQVTAPGVVLLLRSADIILLPLRQISGGVVSFMVPIISRGGASQIVQARLFCAAGGLGAIIAFGFLLLRQTSLPDLLPERFAIAISEGGLLLAALFVTHFLAAVALGLLRGTFSFGRLVWVSVFANGFGIFGLVAVIAVTEDWRVGLAGFIVTDLMFLIMTYLTKRKVI